MILFENMAELSGKPSGSFVQHSGDSSNAFTGRAEEETLCAGHKLPSAEPSTTNSGDPGFAAIVKGKNYARNQRKKQNRKTALIGKTSISGEANSSKPSLRLQIRLEKGYFTNALKDELMKGLNTLLYQTPPNSFIPTFLGSGLRYGKIWFSPENQESYDWLKQSLLLINEKAVVDFKFAIEQYDLHRNSICLRIPWNASEDLKRNDVLNRLVFQNPNILANFWGINKVIPSEKGHHLFFFNIGDDSLVLLKKQNFLVNYGFQKVFVRVLSNKTESNTRNGASSSTAVDNVMSS